jgi:hypothetical protein
MAQPVVARPRRASPILVCDKCLRRSSDGRNIKREIKQVLKSRGTKKQKRPRLVSTSCFGICPKKAVVLASGSSLQEGEYLLVSDRREVKIALDGLLPPDEQVPANGAPD